MIAEGQHLREVVPGIDVHDRKRDPGRRERLLRQPQHHDRVLAAREQQHRPLELGHHLTHHEDALRFKRIQMRDAVDDGLAHGRNLIV
jgi:hypothetical protein